MSTVLLGAGENVKLSDKEFGDLVTRYGQDVTLGKIEDLSHYLKRRRKRYVSHYWVLREWIRRDKTIEVATPPSSTPLLDEADLVHRAQILQRVRIREGLTPNDFESCLKAIREIEGEK